MYYNDGRSETTRIWMEWYGEGIASIGLLLRVWVRLNLDFQDLNDVYRGGKS